MRNAIPGDVSGTKRIACGAGAEFGKVAAESDDRIVEVADQKRLLINGLDGGAELQVVRPVGPGKVVAIRPDRNNAALRGDRRIGIGDQTKGIRLGKRRLEVVW